MLNKQLYSVSTFYADPRQQNTHITVSGAKWQQGQKRSEEYKQKP